MYCFFDECLQNVSALACCKMYCQYSLSNAVRKLTTIRQAGDQTQVLVTVCVPRSDSYIGNEINKIACTNCNLLFVNNLANVLQPWTVLFIKKVDIKYLETNGTVVAYPSKYDNVSHSRLEAVNEINFFSARNLDRIPKASVNHPFWIPSLTSLYKHFLLCHVEKMVLGQFDCWHDEFWLIGLEIVITCTQ